jgi:hypothetical protein
MVRGTRLGGLASDRPRAIHGSADGAVQGVEPGAAARHELAAEQVDRLDAVGVLVDRVEPVIAVVLLEVVLAGVAITAVHPDREVVGVQAPLGGPTLRDRGENVEQQPRLLPAGLVVGGAQLIQQLPTVEDQAEPTFHVGLLREQHPAHVGVCGDRHRRRGRALRAGGPSLRTRAGIIQRREVAGVAEGDRAGTDADPGFVHHMEHLRESGAPLADQVTDRAGGAARAPEAMLRTRGLASHCRRACPTAPPQTSRRHRIAGHDVRGCPFPRPTGRGQSVRFATRPHAGSKTTTR